MPAPKPPEMTGRLRRHGPARTTQNSMVRRGLRAPRGWIRFATPACGVPVFTPRDPRQRRELFADVIAYVDNGAVWVPSKTAWLRDRQLRQHEEAHLAQIAWLGEERFELLYGMCSCLGYRLNPFEVAARWAEGVDDALGRDIT